MQHRPARLHFLLNQNFVWRTKHGHGVESQQCQKTTYRGRREAAGQQYGIASADPKGLQSHLICNNAIKELRIS